LSTSSSPIPFAHNFLALFFVFLFFFHCLALKTKPLVLKPFPVFFEHLFFLQVPSYSTKCNSPLQTASSRFLKPPSVSNPALSATQLLTICASWSVLKCKISGVSERSLQLIVLFFLPPLRLKYLLTATVSFFPPSLFCSRVAQAVLPACGEQRTPTH
jgi:hypothetical protein